MAVSLHSLVTTGFQRLPGQSISFLLTKIYKNLQKWMLSGIISGEENSVTRCYLLFLAFHIFYITESMESHYRVFLHILWSKKNQFCYL